MKKTLILISLAICSSTLFAQQENDILGYWLNEEGDAKIQINKNNDIFSGEIVWLEKPKDENGEWRLDTENPDESLRNRKKLGLQILHNLTWDADKKEWNNGDIYDAREGDTYSLFAKLKNENTLDLRGYIGFSLFGKTTRWTRTNLEQKVVN